MRYGCGTHIVVYNTYNRSQHSIDVRPLVRTHVCLHNYSHIVFSFLQALLSETSPDDSHWPPELILLREKFTAKSQLEIAQLQIAHKDEMDRLRIECSEKQLSRKQRRHHTFDENRDLDQIVLERDNLRELCHTFRWLLSELAKCVSVCEDDLNRTLLVELQRHGIQHGGTRKDTDGDVDETMAMDADADDNDNDADDADADVSLGSVRSGDVMTAVQRSPMAIGSTSMMSATTTTTAVMRLVPDVSGILEVIDDPSLLDFVEQYQQPGSMASPQQQQHSKESSFNLNECVDRLKTEAMLLLELSENMFKMKKTRQTLLQLQPQQKRSVPSEKGDSCEEEDGLKSKSTGKHRWLRHNNSLNETILSGNNSNMIVANGNPKERLSLPGSWRMGGTNASADGDSGSIGSANEMNDLRNRLLVADAERTHLRGQLAEAREQIEVLRRQDEDVSEG